MDGTEPIGDDEVLLRRIPPPTLNLASAVPRTEGGLRATSARLTIRDDEHGLSCSRLALTSPQTLLDSLLLQHIDPAGWMVCRVFAKDIRQLGLEIVPMPESWDPGHCQIVDGDLGNYPNKKATKLAKKTRILASEEIQRILAEDTIED